MTHHLVVPLADLRAQHDSIRAEIDTAVRGVIDDSAFVGGMNNRHTSRFEEAFAGYLGIPHCVTCANGTDAIELALSAFGIGAGDEVLVPALSWISTAEAVSNVGATPVFVDTQPEHCAIDPSLIDAARTSRTKAIIVVHLHGRPVDMRPILDIANRHGLRVIEDCAQAHGARYGDAIVGTLGDAATYSFFPSKNLGAIGDAGAVVTPHAEIADKVRLLANHGQRQKNEHLIVGRNSRLDGVQAAVLSAKLPHLDAWNALRRSHAATMSAALAGLPGLRVPPTETDRTHAYHLFVVRLERRDALAAFLRQRSIATAVHYPTPMPCSAAYAGGVGVRGRYPNALAQGRELLSLPLFPEMTREQIDAVVGGVRDFCNAGSA